MGARRLRVLSLLISSGCGSAIPVEYPKLPAGANQAFELTIDGAPRTCVTSELANSHSSLVAYCTDTGFSIHFMMDKIATTKTAGCTSGEPTLSLTDTKGGYNCPKSGTMTLAGISANEAWGSFDVTWDTIRSGSKFAAHVVGKFAARHKDKGVAPVDTRPK